MRSPHTVPVVQSIDAYTPGQTFEQLVVSKFQPYLGRSIPELCTEFAVKWQQGTAVYRALTKVILGIPLACEIEEFEKGDVHIRAVFTHQPQYPKRRKRYFLWHVDKQQTRLCLHKVEFWTPAISDQNFIDPPPSSQKHSIGHLV